MWQHICVENNGGQGRNDFSLMLTGFLSMSFWDPILVSSMPVIGRGCCSFLALAFLFSKGVYWVSCLLDFFGVMWPSWVLGCTDWLRQACCIAAVEWGVLVDGDFLDCSFEEGWLVSVSVIIGVGTWLVTGGLTPFLAFEASSRMGNNLGSTREVHGYLLWQQHGLLMLLMPWLRTLKWVFELTSVAVTGLRDFPSTTFT